MLKNHKVNVTTYTFPNSGYLIADVPEDLLLEIKGEISEIQTDFESGVKKNDHLAGNIKHEYALVKCIANLEKFAIKSMLHYDEQFNHLKSINVLTHSVPYALSQTWVNFQRKGEFNPNHNHSGVMSFVIWVKIPYAIEDELQHESVRDSLNPSAGVFEFTYANVLGNICEHKVKADRMYEGKMIMFPSTMTHCVYPFYTSDDYRISISGNLALKTG